MLIIYNAIEYEPEKAVTKTDESGSAKRAGDGGIPAAEPFKKSHPFRAENLNAWKRK